MHHLPLKALDRDRLGCCKIHGPQNMKERSPPQRGAASHTNLEL